MVATQGLGKQLVLQDEKLDCQDVQVPLTPEVRPTLQTVKIKCVHGDVITYPSATVDLKIDGWERKITVAFIPDVPVDVVLAWSDHSLTVEVNHLVTTRAQRRWQLQEMMQGEVEATLSNSVQVTEDLEVEGKGEAIHSWLEGL